MSGSRSLAVLAALVFALVPAAARAAGPPPIDHVFVIVLENEDAATTFGPGSQIPYLAQTLRGQGVFLPNYYGTGHNSLDNYLSMVSGQAPNPSTQADCPLYTNVLPGTIGASGQAIGTGCVYPAAVKTVADQLEARGLTWKGYMEDMGADPARDGGTTCAHPAIGTPDRSQSAAADDQYAARHNPFVYFHSIIDRPACAANDVPLSRLPADLGSAAGTPSLSFITPDLCHDGHDATCADGGPGGLPAADAFLRAWVPRIIGSPAFAHGLLVITFDEAENDSSACCGEPPGPNTPSPGGQKPGPGGGRVGAVALSPFIRPGSTSTHPYNHYALLRSIEDLFRLGHLGYAAQAGLRPFGSDVYSLKADPVPPPAPAGCHSRSLRGMPRRLAHGTLVRRLHATRHGRRVTVRFRATHRAKVTVRRGHRHRTVGVRACRSYRVRLRGGHGARVRVIARAGRRSERRWVRPRA
jgi:phosphatidylinositol-3-phosphatase